MTERPEPDSGRASAVKDALDRALAAAHRRRYEEAERLAAGALEIEPDNLLATQLLASALIGQGRGPEAIVPLRRAAERGADAATETFLGQALAGAGQAAEALEALRSAVSRRPAFTPAFAELACQLAAAGRLDEATAVLEEGLALAPGAPGLLLALAGLHLQRNNREAARDLFEAAHAAESNRIDGLVGLARVNFMDGDYAAAAGCYRRALALQPADVMLRIELAKCLLETGAQEEGESMLRTAATTPVAAAQGAVALAASAHGRFFLRPSRALDFVRGQGVPG